MGSVFGEGYFAIYNRFTASKLTGKTREGGGGTEWVPTAKRPRGAEVVNTRT